MKNRKDIIREAINDVIKSKNVDAQVASKMAAGSKKTPARRDVSKKLEYSRPLKKEDKRIM